MNMLERAVALYAMLFSRKRLPPNSSGLYRTRRPFSVAAAATTAQMPHQGLHKGDAVRWGTERAATCLLSPYWRCLLVLEGSIATRHAYAAVVQLM